MTVVINFAGAPSAGKSTNAAKLFVVMKERGFKVELINEYAKELSWEQSKQILEDQVFVAASQNRRQERLRGKVDYIITDSPLFLADVYKPDFYKEQYPSFSKLIDELWESYTNIVVFIKRAPSKPYMQYGRHHTESEEEIIEQKILSRMANLSSQTLSALRFNSDNVNTETIIKLAQEVKVIADEKT